MFTPKILKNVLRKDMLPMCTCGEVFLESVQQILDVFLVVPNLEGGAR
jgi:hypothetical protein